MSALQVSVLAPEIAPMRGPWMLSQLDAAPRLGFRVVSTFSGGGGSSMGYRLAGLDVVAAVEIDPQMADCYERNLGVGKVVRAPVGDVAKWTDKELAARFGRVDVLDGSPPCSVFSSAGSREDKWGSEHMFREGQAVQKLDALFLDFVELARRLRPRIVIGENVTGMIKGAAKGYVLEVHDAFEKAGYDTQLFVLDASRMGVPQRRQRVFFVARRKDLNMPPLALAFDEAPITAREATFGASREGARPLPPSIRPWWHLTPIGRSISTIHPRGRFWSHIRTNPDAPFSTVLAEARHLMHWEEPRAFSPAEIRRAQTFPEDYDSLGQDVKYLCGMSVPPQMARRVGLAVASWVRAAIVPPHG